MPPPRNVPRPRAAQHARAALTGQRSLRLLLVLSVVVPLLLLGCFSVYRYQQMEAEAELRLKRALSIAHEHALRLFAINRTLLEHMRDLAPLEAPLTTERQRRLHAELVEMVGGQPQVHAVHVYDAQGRVQASSQSADAGEALAAGESYSGAPWVPGPSGTGAPLATDVTRIRGLQLTDLVPAATGGERLFDMHLGLADASDRFAGLLSVTMRANYFEGFHATLAAEEPGVAITVFREDGLVYSRWPALASAPPRMSPQGEVLSRVIAGERQGTVRNVSSLDQQKRLILFSKLGDFPVYIGVGREFGALKSELLREIALLAAFGAVPVFGIVITAWLAMQRTRQALVSASRLRAESDARRQAEEALFQSQKMEALGRLTGGVAHDFNNALMVIGGNVHLLRRSVPEAARRHLEAIGRAVDSSAQLTRQLLAFSRRQALAPEIFLLQDRLPAMQDLLVPTLGSAVTLSIWIDPDTPPVHLDAAELELALINLAVNARDAMPAGGHFALRASAAPASGPAGQAEAGWVLIEASDNGDGMDPAVAAKAFDPFFTTKPAGKGTGLGLSQVYALCERAGGQAEIRTSPGAGTTVSLRLPASAQPPAPARAVSPSQQALGRSVLLVEDNPEVSTVVHAVLEQLDCTVMAVNSAAAALDELARDASRFDLVLTDVVMPGGMDGANLAGVVRERYPALQILLMTGYAQQIQAIDAMGFRVLPKPFTPEVLAEALGALDAATLG